MSNKSSTFAAEFKNKMNMKAPEIKFDSRNYRKHSEQNKKVIKKSLQELGAGRSVVIDADDTLVAGNGVYEQAQKLKMPVRVVETDGSELVVVKRTDIHTDDEKRRKLALADNAAGDLSEWNDDLLRADWAQDALAEFGVELPDDNTEEEAQRRLEEFKEKIAAGEMREEDEEYQQFLDKFKLKKTTDDCYTPDIVYNAVADWVSNEYGLDRKSFLRPFYPGGDYKNEKYPKGCVVVDNPPFSILSDILTDYKERGVKFFLFAPHLKLFSSSSSSSSALVTGVVITYENGANVSTSFLTNLEPEDIRARSCPSLYASVTAANNENLCQMRKELPKYAYDHHVVTSAMLGPFSKLGIDFILTKSETVAISQLDAQKERGKTIYGNGYLISERLFAEREKAEREKAERWELSEREKAIIKKLSKK